MSARKASAGDGPYPLPEGWRWVRLGEVCDVVVGRTPARKDPQFWGSGHPWVSIADMNQGRFLRSTKEQITELGSVKGKRIPAGTVLFSFKLSIGKVSVAQMPVYTNEAIAALPILDPSMVSSDYIYHALSSMDASGGANRAAMGSTLNKAQVSALTIPLPPLSEQRRIAEILNSVSELSAKAIRREELFHALRISMFREMFPENKTSTIELGEICKLHSGSTPSKKESRYWNGQIPWFSAKDLKATELYDSQDHVSQDALDETSLKLRPAGSIAMVVRGMILARTFPVSILRTTSATNQDLKVIEPTEGINTEFLAAALKSRSQWVLDRALTSAHGTKRLEMSLLESIPIPDVSTEEQDLFAARVAQIRALAASSLDLDTSLSKMLINLQLCAFRGEL